MTFTLKNLTTALAATGTLLLTACGPTAQDDHHIKVGISAGIDQSLWAVVQKVAKQKYDLDVEVVTFNDYVLPNEALNNGDLDVNAFQHKPYLDKQMQERGYKLAAVGNTFVYPIAGYSKKITALSQLPDGAQVAVPNDPTNRAARCCCCKTGADHPERGRRPAADRAGHRRQPEKLKIVEIEAPQLPRALDDQKVTLAIINTNYSSQIGLSPAKDGLFVEDKTRRTSTSSPAASTTKTARK